MSRIPGTKPAPTELKLLRGNPGRRPLGNRVRGDLPERVPPFPPSLGKVGRAEWTRYWEHGRAWLAHTDIAILTQLCEAQDEAADLRDRIFAEGFTQMNDKTGRSAAHHLYNDLRGLRREIRELWSLCYMTPTDRGRANVKVVETDPLAEWASQ